jgi:hypothetical protein
MLAESGRGKAQSRRRERRPRKRGTVRPETKEDEDAKQRTEQVVARRARRCGGERQAEKETNEEREEREASDGRLNGAPLPSPLSCSTSSRLAISVRARLCPARRVTTRSDGQPILYPEQRLAQCWARRRRISACRSPHPPVRTRDTSLLSSSFRFAVLPTLSERQTGRYSVQASPRCRDAGVPIVLRSPRARVRPSPWVRPLVFLE